RRAVTTLTSEIECDNQNAAEIVSSSSRKPPSSFFVAQTSQPLVNFRRCDLGNRFSIEGCSEVCEAAPQIAQVTFARTVRLFDLQKFIDKFHSRTGAFRRFQVRQIKVDGIANRCVERFERFRAFQILGPLPLVKRVSSSAVVFLFDPLRLQKRFRFVSIFEEPSIATIPDFRPNDAEKRATVDIYFAELRCSLAHSGER